MFLDKLKTYFKDKEGVEFAIAYGSLGKGELSTYLDDNSNKRVYNDIDLIIVVKEKKIFIDQLESIHQELKDMFQTPWVDILFWSFNDLKKNRKTIFYFDFVNGHELLKGTKEDLEPLLNRYPSSEIKKFDIYKMYLTRLWALASLYLNDSFFENFPEGFQSYQAAKAIIATVDFDLLSNDQYHSKLEEKVRILSDQGDCPDLLPLLNQAIETKQNPTKNSLIFLTKEKKLIRNIHKQFEHSFSKNFSQLPFSINLVITYYNTLFLGLACIRCLMTRKFNPIRQAYLRIQIIKELRKVNKNPKSINLSLIEQNLNKSI